MIDSRTVMELPRTERSTSEIENLWDYIAGQLERHSIVTPVDLQPTPAPITRSHTYSDTPPDTPVDTIEGARLRAVGGNI